jgi:Ala-tRNA(Pro) deacylase
MAISHQATGSPEQHCPPETNPTYQRLIELLTQGSARYRFIAHAREGETVAASRLRGHPLSQAAKSMVLRVSSSRRTSRYVLGVVPGDRRVSFATVQQLFGSRSASLATAGTAERLAGAVSGAIPPFSFHADLPVVVDPALLIHQEIFFNAARLDESLALHTDDYLRLSNPRIEAITEPDSAYGH